jgi:hypothetical protein
MINPAMWGRLPAELRERPQWIIVGDLVNKVPLSVDSNGNLYAAKTTDPSQWMPFELAAYHASQRGYAVGYVLSADDPFTCIDFDVCDEESQRRKGKPVDADQWTTPDQYYWFRGLCENFDSYTEISVWGKGLHLWVKGKLPGGKGIRKGHVEMYCQERYIICTGNVALDRPVQERSEWVAGMAEQMRSDKPDEKKFELVELPQVLEDDAVWQMASNADNAFNFRELCSGRWQQFGHPSQSEADLALMSMFTFYSESNEQCRRMFRATALGQREKATKNNRYLDETLRRIRSRQSREKLVNLSGLTASADELRKLRRSPQLQALNDPSTALATPPPAPQNIASVLAAPHSAATVVAGSQGLPWPPGFAGYLARFIYDSAPRPVKEVAIVGALGLLAGITAKGWTIPNSGLNVYMILVAQSAVGKEAMHSGVSALVTAAARRSPAVSKFVDFSDFASGPALVKACSSNPCFVNVCGEWGHKLRRLANESSNDTAMASLRRAMTDLYQKSGPTAIVGGISYSQKEGNIASISGVAYSMIGETTPKTLYTSLTESMMEDGFLSRFIIVEYAGDRPPLNTDQRYEPEPAISDYLAQMASQAQQLISTVNNRTPVGRTEEAAILMRDFELECDKQINSTKDESWRQMWNRASLKVMRVAGLLAVADNYIHPCITKDHVEWAMQLIRSDIHVMRRRMESGDVGIDDYSRENKVVSIMRDYFTNGCPDGYAVPDEMPDNGIVPHLYLQKKTQKHPAFMSHKLGSTEGLKQVMRSLVEQGYIQEADKLEMVKHYKFHGKCYRLLKLPDLDAERLGK